MGQCCVCSFHTFPFKHTFASHPGVRCIIFSKIITPPKQPVFTGVFHASMALWVRNEGQKNGRAALHLCFPLCFQGFHELHLCKQLWQNALHAPGSTFWQIRWECRVVQPPFRRSSPPRTLWGTEGGSWSWLFSCFVFCVSFAVSPI